MSSEPTSRAFAPALMPPPGGGNGGPPPPLPVSLYPIGAVPGAQPRVPPPGRGGWEGRGFQGPFTITVTVGGLPYGVVFDADGTWYATVRFYRAGSIPVSAHIKDATSGKSKNAAPRNVAVTLDSATVDVVVTQPVAGVVRV